MRKSRFHSGVSVVLRVQCPGEALTARHFNLLIRQPGDPPPPEDAATGDRRDRTATRLTLLHDERIVAYKKSIRSTAYRIFQGVPWECPVYLEILFLMQRPQNKTWKRRPMPRYPHTSVPDVDNLTQAVKDSLTGVVYRDDSLVANSHSSKWVCAGGELPKTIIKLAKIEG